MKKADSRKADDRIIPSSGNVFMDLGFDEAEARVMALRVQVMVQIEQKVREHGWTQVEAAKRLGITQPRVSKIKRGAWEEFSLDMLVTLASRAGLKPELRV